MFNKKKAGRRERFPAQMAGACSEVGHYYRLHKIMKNIFF